MGRIASLAWYISGHGFGHASREIEIINVLGPRLPHGVEILIRTSAAQWLFERTVRVPFTYLPRACDTGVAQIDSLRLDDAGTVREAAEFSAAFDTRVAEEARILRSRDVRLVIADAPPLACAAAAVAGVPCIVISNFTWDWIYEGYRELFARQAPEVLPRIREAYAAASAGWRLPMHGGFATIDPIVDLPFVARHARHGRQDVIEVLGLPAGRRLALSSFGGYGVRDLDLTRLDCLDTWTVVITGPEPPASELPRGVVFVDETRIYDTGARYEDLVAAVDVVVTKPGYGIVSECVANRTAMLYTSRGYFVEYDVMVREMPKVLRCRFLDQESLLAGRWRAALDALLEAPLPPDMPRTDGAEVAATGIAEMAGIAEREQHGEDTGNAGTRGED
jgi:L-arabinokinase